RPGRPRGAGLAEPGGTARHDRDAVREARGLHRSAARPPSQGTTAPLVYADASLARKSATCAMSSAVPRRASGTFLHSPLKKPSGSDMVAVTLRKRGVSIEPGAITL